MKAIPFKITNKIKCLWINLTKEVKDPHIENNKIPMKEMERDVKQEDSPCSQTRRINNAKLLILSKAIYMFDANSIKFTIEIEE